MNEQHEVKWMIGHSGRYSRHAQLAQVVGQTKTQWKIQIEGESRERRVAKRSGKELGYERYWREVKDIDAERQRIAEAEAKQAAERQRREQWYNDRLAQAKAANPTLNILPVANEVKAMVAKGAKGQEVVIVFATTTRENWREETVYHVAAVMKDDSSFGSTSAEGASEEDALYALIMSWLF